MRILVIGVNGQVGWELARSLSVIGTVVTVDRARADLSRPDLLPALVADIAPDVIVNAAAYTAVDHAEADEALATTVNGEAVYMLAEAAHKANALFVHYSTDYVFDGRKSCPYVESDVTAPLNAYGRSKLAGEAALRDSKGDWLAFRTTWVYAERAKNFVKTILRLAAEREELRIVSDQIGAPTWARAIADATAHAVRAAVAERALGSFRSGLYHMTAGGETSWHGFAQRIVQEVQALHPELLLKVRRIVPIVTDDYPLPAARPQNSVLSNVALRDRFNLELPHWEHSLHLCLANLPLRHA